MTFVVRLRPGEDGKPTLCCWDIEDAFPYGTNEMRVLKLEPRLFTEWGGPLRALRVCGRPACKGV